MEFYTSSRGVNLLLGPGFYKIGKWECEMGNYTWAWARCMGWEMGKSYCRFFLFSFFPLGLMRVDEKMRRWMNTTSNSYILLGKLTTTS